MAQLESGKLYIVPNVGMRDYVNENGSEHSTEEYFIWMVNKIATGLNITPEYHIIDGDNNIKHCFFTLPYINEPNNNKLQLYIKASSTISFTNHNSSVNTDTLTVNISYVNGNDYYIPASTNYLPSLTFFDQYVMVKYKNYSDWSRAAQGSDLRRSYNHSFVIDTHFLEKGGFYTINFFDGVVETSDSGKIEDIAFTPKIFVCDMINVLNKQHYDGFFFLNGWNQSSYIINKTNNELKLDKPSISAIGIGADEKYSLQGFYPQVFVSDYNSTYYSDNPDILTGSMIRLQFGKLRAYKNIYILLSNSLHKLMQCCGKDNVLNNHISWNKDVLKVNNKNFTLSCSCNYSISGTPAYAQWAVAIEDDEKPKPEVKGYLEFSSDKDFYLQVSSSPEWNGTMEYSIDGGSTWGAWKGKKINGTSTQSIFIRGTGNNVVSKGYSRWVFTGKYIKGNIETLLDYKTVLNDKHPSMLDYCYYGMFSYCTSLIEAPELPATKLADYCYYYMFSGCTSLTKAPELPATELASHCYSYMFRGCTSLTKAPKLPATKLTNYCYQSMFNSCTSLTEAPKLPATTLADCCYESMFYNCTSLTKAPKLPATELANGCYGGMFYYCDSLIEIPKLSAITLVDSCYYNMFRDCYKIKISTIQSAEYPYEYRIPKEGVGTTARDALYRMFTGTGGTFTGSPTMNRTYYTSNEIV